MATPLQKLARLTGRIFSSITKHQDGIEQKKQLVEHMNSITLDDIPFERRYLQNTGKWRREYGSPPVTYVQLWEGEIFTMGVFILKNGVRLPLHDHPNMQGFIKVIHGKALIHSFTMLDDMQPPPHVIEKLQGILRSFGQFDVRCAERLPDAIVQPQDPTCCLSPTQGNVHEIWAVDGPMAFLDILSPPYDHETGVRECHYYRDTGTLSNSISDGERRYLLRIEQPNDFWCDTTPYLGDGLDPYSDSDGTDTSTR